jgi:phosphatidylglycerol:prolipoprotein diacylglycerol transferase
MYPILFHIGNFTLRTYGVIVALAMIAGIFLAMHFAKTRLKISEDDFLSVAIWAIVGGIVGARIFWILVSPGLSFYLVNPLKIFAIWEGGLSFEGMFFGGLIAVIFAVKHYKISLWGFLDILSPGVAIGYGIGKLACFFNGCCHGTVVPLWWPKFFPLVNIFTNPNSECELLNQPLFPTQLLNSLGGWVSLFVVLWVLTKKRAYYYGQVFVVFSYVFALMLFLVDFIRYIPTRFLGLTPNQWSAIAMVVLATILHFILRKKVPMPQETA